MAEAERKGHAINFDVLYYAKEKYYDQINQEIGEKEGEYIRAIQPILNTQIPRAENWQSFDIKPINTREIWESIL